MRFKCYQQDDEEIEDEYAGEDLSPLDAALTFAEEWIDEPGDHRVIVVPLDDEACALPGWQRDADTPAFRCFVATGRVEWEGHEVASFDSLTEMVAPAAPRPDEGA